MVGIKSGKKQESAAILTGNDEGGISPGLYSCPALSSPSFGAPILIQQQIPAGNPKGGSEQQPWEGRGGSCGEVRGVEPSPLLLPGMLRIFGKSELLVGAGREKGWREAGNGN